jgi:glucose/arabinose dehydrogenase
VQLLADGFDRPMIAVPDPKNPDRLFVVEQGGRVKILEPGMTSAPDANFMDLDVKNKNPTGEIGAEQGLLGFAFHPDFPDDPRVYVNYNPAQNGTAPTVVSEFKLDPSDPNKVDMASEREVIIIDQPASNHNGGMIDFGSDGYLYIGMGDGGGANDTYNTGRDPLSLHAKILRIDVEPDGMPDSNKACDACDMVDGFDYTVPADNPFVGDSDYAPEIWAWGFRNPWRFFFDPPTDTLYTADVGQNQYEEIDIVSKGADYGWSDMEGNHCFQGAACDESAGPNQANADGMVAPITEYDHGTGCSVTGGAVYHSCEVPAWDGIYFYGDYCAGSIFALRWDGTNVMELGEVVSQEDRVLGFGYTGHGDVLFTVVQLDEFNVPVNGKILRIAPQ